MFETRVVVFLKLKSLDIKTTEIEFDSIEEGGRRKISIWIINVNYSNKCELHLKRFSNCCPVHIHIHIHIHLNASVKCQFKNYNHRNNIENRNRNRNIDRIEYLIINLFDHRWVAFDMYNDILICLMILSLLLPNIPSTFRPICRESAKLFQCLSNYFFDL